MKNGIAYPLAPSVIDMIEKKRKEFCKNRGVRISQAKFTNIIAPKLRLSIQNIKINTKKTIKFKRRKRWK